MLWRYSLALKELFFFSILILFLPSSVVSNPLEGKIADFYKNKDFESTNLYCRQYLKNKNYFSKKEIESIYFKTEANLLYLDQYLDNKKNDSVSIQPKLFISLFEKISLGDPLNLRSKWVNFFQNNYKESKVYSQGLLLGSMIYYNSGNKEDSKKIFDMVDPEKIKKKTYKKIYFMLRAVFSKDENEFLTRHKDFSTKFKEPLNEEKLDKLKKEFLLWNGLKEKMKNNEKGKNNIQAKNNFP